MVPEVWDRETSPLGLGKVTLHSTDRMMYQEELQVLTVFVCDSKVLLELLNKEKFLTFLSPDISEILLEWYKNNKSSISWKWKKIES